MIDKKLIYSSQEHKLERYRWIYDAVISKLYDKALHLSLTPFGERLLRESVFNAVTYKPKDKILDLCCGTGTLILFLAKLLYQNCEIYGIDISQGQIHQAKKKNKVTNLRFMVMNAADLKFNNNRFDKVIISAALHEMDSQLRMKVLSEAFRVLKKEGFLIIFEHNEPKEPLLRILYNFYLGFMEKILSHSFEMQRHIFMELKKTGFIIKKQVFLVKKWHKFFQIIVCKK
jgi:ubiquinone/menaquinone biosynthesis C-methylase UbiE